MGGRPVRGSRERTTPGCSRHVPAAPGHSRRVPAAPGHSRLLRQHRPARPRHGIALYLPPTFKDPAWRSYPSAELRHGPATTATAPARPRHGLDSASACRNTFCTLWRHPPRRGNAKTRQTWNLPRARGTEVARRLVTPRLWEGPWLRTLASKGVPESVPERF